MKICTIALMASSLLMLAACGGNSTPAESSTTPATSQGEGTAYTFSDAYFFVKADYSGTKIAYPSAVAEQGDYPAITDMSLFNFTAGQIGENGPMLGFQACLDGNYTYKDGKYYTSSTQISISACTRALATYSKADKKLTFTGIDDEVKEFYENFADVSHYTKVIATDGTLSSVDDLADKATVRVTYPQVWLARYLTKNKDISTINYTYAGLYLA